MKLISPTKLRNEILPILDKIFDDAYNSFRPTEYHMRSSYGKYSIYRWDYEDGKRTSTTLAKRLSREEATGMMKLLKGANDE